MSIFLVGTRVRNEQIWVHKSNRVSRRRNRGYPKSREYPAVDHLSAFEVHYHCSNLSASLGSDFHCSLSLSLSNCEKGRRKGKDVAEMGRCARHKCSQIK
ncbi:hypothetical protein EUGRSUZ_I01287 [Eucalyptus grandis]|uniref:Uncharacterized protein n=2 Tax=Eucalyptus grandis TaxID=71139 RepID=A0ACC3JEV9_EUCGR|nr:hypothetical protein EUGRSUZ_I01287 [Eucalyptus grandis]